MKGEIVSVEGGTESPFVRMTFDVAKPGLAGVTIRQGDTFLILKDAAAEDDCLLLERAAITLRMLDFPELAGRLDGMRRRYENNTTL